MRPYKLLDSLYPLVFDGNEALCFIVNLHNSVNSARVKNIAPGALYTIIFHQDASGGNVFTWPLECQNATVVDTGKGATTVQNFIGDTGGFLQASVPAAWT